MGTSSNARTPIHLVRNPLPVGSPSSRSRKRKIDVVDLTQDEPVDEVAEAAANAALAGNTTPKKRAKKATPSPSKSGQAEEKRLKRYRDHAPQAYLERLDRARSQRMFLIDRNRRRHESGEYDEEVFDIAGTTGNIYTVTISKVPRCSCPDAGKGNQCKHIIYVRTPALRSFF